MSMTRSSSVRPHPACGALWPAVTARLRSNNASITSPARDSIHDRPRSRVAARATSKGGGSERFWTLRGYGPPPHNEWEGLLPDDNQPVLDDGLRAEIRKYGDLAAAVYDAVHPVRVDSEYTGLAKWPPHQLLQNSSISSSSPAQGYTVLKYLYNNVGVFNLGSGSGVIRSILRLVNSGDDDRSPNLVGFISVSPEHEDGSVDLAIALRGTMFVEDWVYNIAGDSLGDWLDYDSKTAMPGGLKVHNGFAELYCLRLADNNGEKSKLLSLRQVLLEVELPELLAKYNVRTISTTGHSLGGALATLVAYDINDWLDRSGIWPPTRPPITVFSFASPRLGNKAFQDRFDAACRNDNIRHLRVVNIPDGVPTLPGLFHNFIVGGFRLFGVDLDDADRRGGKLAPQRWVGDRLNPLRNIWGYNHVGRKLRLDSGLWGEKCRELLRPLQLWDFAARHDMVLYDWLLATQYKGPAAPAAGPTGPLPPHSANAVSIAPLLPIEAGATGTTSDAASLPTDVKAVAPIFANRDYSLLNKFNNVLAAKWDVKPYWGLRKESADTPVWRDPVLSSMSSMSSIDPPSDESV